METCLKCEYCLEIDLTFDSLFDIIICPSCGNKMEVDFEENYDTVYFWLKNVKE